MSRAAALGLAILTSGCSLTAEIQGGLETELPEARVTSAQFRLWVTDAVLHGADRIEEAAERIQAETSDPAVRRNVILWKINAVQACFRAGTHRDSLASFVDLWIFSQQMATFLDSGPGRDLFGVHQHVALTTARAIEARLEKTIVSAMKPEAAERGLQEVREYVESFAKKHPLQTIYFVREPITGHPESPIASAVGGIGAVVSGLEQDLLTFQRLAAAYLEYLPRIARWQAELMLEGIGKAGIAEIDRQRRETLEDIREVARDTTASAVLPGKQLIDYLVGRVVLIVATVASFFALGLALIVIFLRSKAAGPAPPPAL